MQSIQGLNIDVCHQTVSSLVQGLLSLVLTELC